MPRHTETWEDLPYAAWRDTMDTLHMELQVIGKLRLALTPVEPQWGNVPLYLTARGLTTTPMASGDVIFEVNADLLDHQVLVVTTAGAPRRVPLTARPVAAFYKEFIAALDGLGIRVKVSPRPAEVTDPIPFPEDFTHTAYDPTWATRFFRVLSRVDLALKEFRAPFRGKTSLVQFFWGTFDLALIRYSGRPAPVRPGAGIIERVSAGAEVICLGFWPGNAKIPMPAFFGYAHPKPPGIEREPVRPAAARWEPTAGEFLLAYDDVRRAPSPKEAILEFCESVYEAGARRMAWEPELVIARQPSAR